MRKTRSQTQAEKAILSGSAKNSSRSGIVSSSTTSTNHPHQLSQQPLMNPGNPRSAQVSANLSYIDPAILKECEEMVSLLRVVELHKILSYLNINFSGRKVDYQHRILGFLRTNFDLVAPKVREVYTQSIVEQQANQYGPPDPKRMYSQMQMQPNAAGMVGANAAAQMGAAQQILNPASQAGMQAGVPPGNNVVPFLHAIPTQMPIHPDVRLKKLAFYDVLGTLIKPSSLVPRNAQRIQEVPFYFTLTPQQATEIASNRDIRNSSKIEHAIQVQLRFCLLETSCDQEDCFPPSVSVKVNNKLCQLPNVIPTNRPNVEPKRPPRPVNVTSNVKLSPTVTNTITVQWCPDYTRGYCIAVYLVKKLTSAQLLQRMKQKGVKPADYTRALIKEKLTEDADCEIATTMLKVSLNCPLGKMKMSIPCRASTCSHLQCFDASLYLQMNERKPTWNCPVCDKPAVYDHLVIDGYFQEVLASTLLKPDDTEIQLHKDGSWSTHSLRNEGQIIDTPTKPVEKVEVISDDIELITTEDVKPIKAAASAGVNTSEQPSSTTNSETVDLTLSDSDDDLPLAKRRPIAKQNANAGQPSSTVNGNGSAGNQRGGMYMQQKNDDVIISLDSPSPSTSPEPSTDKVLQYGTSFHNTTKTCSTSKTKISTALNRPQEITTATSLEIDLFGYASVKSECFFEYEPNDEQISGEFLDCEDLIEAFCTTINNENGTDSQIVVEVSSFVPNDDIFRENLNCEDTPPCSTAINNEANAIEHLNISEVSSYIPDDDNTSLHSLNCEDLIPTFCTIINDKADVSENCIFTEVSSCVPTNKNIAHESLNCEDLIPTLCTTINDIANANENLNSDELSSYTTNDNNISCQSFNCEDLSPTICTSINSEVNVSCNLNISEFSSLDTISSVSSVELSPSFDRIIERDDIFKGDNLLFKEISALIESISDDESNCSEISNHFSSSSLKTTTKTITSEVVNFKATTSPLETARSSGGKTNLIEETTTKPNNKDATTNCYNTHGGEILSSSKATLLADVLTTDVSSAIENFTESSSSLYTTDGNNMFNCIENLLPLDKATIDTASTSQRSHNHEIPFLTDKSSNVKTRSSDKDYSVAAHISKKDTISLSKRIVNNKDSVTFKTLTDGGRNTRQSSKNKKNLVQKKCCGTDGISNNDTTHSSKILNNKATTTLSYATGEDEQNASEQNGTTPILDTRNDEIITSEKSNEETLTSPVEVTNISSTSLNYNNEVSSSIETNTNGEIISKANLNCNEVTSSVDTIINVETVSKQNISYKEIDSRLDTEYIANNEVISSKAKINQESCCEVTSTFDTTTKKVKVHHIEHVTQGKVIANNLKNLDDNDSSSDEEENIETRSSENLSSANSLANNEKNNKLPQTTKEVASHLDITQLEVPCSDKTKKHFCIFCKTLQTKISRHFLLKHRKEEKVRAIMKLPKKHKERMQIINQLRKEGDFLHNTSKSYNTGMLIVSRQQLANKKNDVNHYVGCKNCKGYFSKVTLRKHLTKCGQSNEKIKGTNKASFQKSDKSMDQDLSNLDVAEMSVPYSSKTKKHFCIFCKTLQTKMPRHFLLKHRSEERIKPIVNLPKKDKERLKVFNQLRKEGDFLHNTSKALNTGILIVSRQQVAKMKKNVDDYACCKYCKGFFSRQTIRKHLNRCNTNNKKNDRTNLIASKRLTQYMHVAANEKLRTNIFPLLRVNAAIKIIRYDELIIKYGNEMAEKYKLPSQQNTVRSHLRLLGRFKMKLKKLCPEMEELKEIFRPEMLNNCLTAFRRTAHWDSDLKCFQTPSVAYNLALLINKCGSLQRNEMNKIQNDTSKCVDEFLVLWNKEVPKLVNREIWKDFDIVHNNNEIDLNSIEISNCVASGEENENMQGDDKMEMDLNCKDLQKTKELNGKEDEYMNIMPDFFCTTSNKVLFQTNGEKSDEGMDEVSSNFDVAKIAIPDSSKTKKHFCIFCKTLQTKIPRHFLSKHRSEERIKAIAKLPKMHKERLKVLNQLRKEGDFLHNTSKELNTGILIVSRQQAANMKKNADDYACCKYCKGFFSRQTLRIHLNRCSTNNKKNDRTNLIASRRLTQYMHVAANEKLRTNIFPLLRVDAVTKIIRYDELIIKYGNEMADKYKLPSQHNTVRSQLRILGRFKMRLKKLCPEMEELKEIFTPKMLNNCLRAFRKAANYDSDLKCFKTPSVAYNLPALINKCGSVQRNELNKTQPDTVKCLDEFLVLWNKEIPKLVNKESWRELKNDQEKLNGNDILHSSKSDASGELNQRNSDKKINERDFNSIEINNSVESGEENANKQGNEIMQKDSNLKNLKKNNTKSDMSAEIYKLISKKGTNERKLNSITSKNKNTNIADEGNAKTQEEDKLEMDSNWKDLQKTKALNGKEDEDEDTNTLPDISNTSDKIEMQTNDEKSNENTDKDSSKFDVAKIAIPYIGKTKKHFCIFCKTLQTKIPRHFLSKHRSEERIKAIAKLPKMHKERLKVLNQLRKEGDFLHNTSKDLNTGILIVSRQQAANMKKNADDYACCKYCKGFFSRQTLRIHLNRCSTNNKKNDRTNLIASRRLTQYMHVAANEKLRTNIFPLLRVDAVTKIIRYDELIIKYGNEMAEKYKLPSQHNKVRSQLRILGRFKMRLKKLCPEMEELKEIFTPKMLNNCLRAFRKAANYDSDLKFFKTPSVAYNLPVLINKCGSVQRNELNKTQPDTVKCLDEFLVLWNKEIPKLVNKESWRELKNDQEKLNGNDILHSSKSDASGELNQRNSDKKINERDFNSIEINNSVESGEENANKQGNEIMQKDSNLKNLKKNNTKSDMSAEIYKLISKKGTNERKLNSITSKNKNTNIADEGNAKTQEEDKLEMDSNWKDLQKTKALNGKEDEDEDTNTLPDISNTSDKIEMQTNDEKSNENTDKDSSKFDVAKIAIPYIGKTKKHFCIFCKTLQTKIPRHFLSKHRSEERIKAIAKLPKMHKERLKVLNQLRKEGDFLHNTSKDLNTGILIVSRQQAANMKKNADDYACCKYCKGFFSRQTLRIHLNRCSTNNKKNDRTNLIASRRLTQYMHVAANEKLRTNIFPLLRVDAVTKIIRYDELIIKYGNEMADKYKLPSQHNTVRSQLRILGRFKMRLKKLCPEMEELKEIFTPKMLNNCLRAFRKAANYDSDLKCFKTPSVAYSLPVLINKCGSVQRNQLNKTQPDTVKRLDEFLVLWNKEIPKLLNRETWKDFDIVHNNNEIDLNSIEISNCVASGEENEYMQGDDKMEMDLNCKDLQKTKELNGKEDEYKNIMPDFFCTTSNKVLLQTNGEKSDEVSSNFDVAKIAIPDSSKTKKHFCIFCKTLQTNIPRHFLSKHRSEERIKAIAKLPKMHKERLKVLNHLRKEGDFLHNTSKELNTGILIVSRQQAANMKKNADDYACCKYCKGFFSRQTLRIHLNRCSKNNKKNDRTNLIASRRLTQYLHEAGSGKLKTEIFPLLKLDEVTKVIRYDELIIKFGNHLAEKFSNVKLYQHLRFRMRLLGRFKIAIKNLCPQLEQLQHIFKPHMLNDCRKAFCKTANWDTELMYFKTPSVAQYLCFDIKKCGNLKRTEFEKLQQYDSKKNLDDFMYQWEKVMAKLVNKTTDGNDDNDLVEQQEGEDVDDEVPKADSSEEDSKSEEYSSSDASEESYGSEKIRSRKRIQKEKSPIRSSRIKRRRWTQQEKDAITSVFGSPHKLRKLPSFRRCNEAINKFSVLKRRTAPQIKSWLDNQRSKKQINNVRKTDEGDYQPKETDEELTKKRRISQRGKIEIEENSSSCSKIKRLRWSQEEQDAITSIFGCLKSLKKLPSLMECTDAINKTPILMNRTAPQLKSWIDNQRRYK